MEKSIIQNKVNKKVKLTKSQNMITTMSKPKGFEKSLQKLLKSNGIGIEIIEYKNFRITKTPNCRYPKMVTISKTTSKLKSLFGKSFVNLQKAMVYIDFQNSLYKIENEKINIEEQLLSMGLGDTNWE